MARHNAFFQCKSLSSRHQDEELPQLGTEAFLPPLMYTIAIEQSLCSLCLVGFQLQLPPALSAWPCMDHWEFNECRLLNEFPRGGNLSLWPCSERGLPMLLI